MSASAANLLINSEFDTDLSSWTVTTAGTGAATFDASFGSPANGSALLNAPLANDRVTLSQCVAITAQSIDLIGRSFTGSSTGTAYTDLFITAFDQTGCAGAALETQSTTTSGFPSWQERTLPNHPLPVGTLSVLVSFFVDAGDSSASVWFDHVLFGPAGTVPVTLQSFEID